MLDAAIKLSGKAKIAADIVPRNAINTVSKDKQKKVVIINGNGELEDRYIADFIKTVRDNYFIAPSYKIPYDENPNFNSFKIKVFEHKKLIHNEKIHLKL